MAKFRKKPVEIEAHTWDGDWDALIGWVDSLGYQEGDGDDRDAMWLEGDTLIIPTLEGDMRGALGDVVICGVQGEFYPCKPHIFEATYDAVGAV